MPTLKKIIRNYMYQITFILVAAILILILYLQMIAEQRQACEDATRTLIQIKSVLEENQKELIEIKEKYTQTCLHNVDIVARIIESNPDVLYDLDEMKEIAESVEIDAIHIFDTTGRIIAGTHPEYYNSTFDSSEQMKFFKPMLEDKTLKLVQDITPDTAKSRPMQYSAAWNEKGEFIVQIGMEPVKVMEVTQKNELSYIFSLFRVSPEASYYAIDAESGEIVGSTNLSSVGSNIADIGLSFTEIKEDPDGFHATVNGQSSFCFFEKDGSNYIGRIITSRNLYQRIPNTIFWVFISLIIVAFFLVGAVTKHMNSYVTDKIHDVNEKLKSIADGNLDETVDIQSSVEFSQLSNYINQMIKSLLDNNKKMSYVLSRTHMQIGAYDYSRHSKRLRFTEYIPQILSVDNIKMEQLASDTDKFILFLNNIRQNSVPNEQGIYQLGEKYIRLEEIENGDDVFGVAIDVTAEITKRKQIEQERDIDLLTGIYNRRGLDLKLIELFREPEKLGYSAVILIDADGLKNINDTYGHDKGDIYLKKISEVISHVGTKGCIASRQGGDEFVLLLHNYDSEEELKQTINSLEDLQSNSYVSLSENITVPLRFSLGYSFVNGNDEYYVLLKDADEKMYKNKLERKKMYKN